MSPGICSVEQEEEPRKKGNHECNVPGHGLIYRKLSVLVSSDYVHLFGLSSC
jgi:hypothetical protein